MAMIAGDPHLSLTVIHDLLTTSTYLGFGADAERERMCCCVRVSDLKEEKNSDRKLLSTSLRWVNKKEKKGGSQTDALFLGTDIRRSQDSHYRRSILERILQVG